MPVNPRAPSLLDLDQAHALLRRTATINDPALRESFLTQIPEHREIAAAWKQRHEPGAAEP